MKETEKKEKGKGGFLKGKPKLVTLLLAAGLIGIFLLGVAPMLSGKETPEEGGPKQEELPTADRYARDLEERLEDVLRQIDGVGEVEVLVTLRQGYSYCYAVTEKENRDCSEDVKNDLERRSSEKRTTEQSYVLVDGKNGSEPLVTATGEPEVRGVVVVCSGGGDPRVVSEVTDTVRVALEISSAKISVSQRSRTPSE